MRIQSIILLLFFNSMIYGQWHKFDFIPLYHSEHITSMISVDNTIIAATKNYEKPNYSYGETPNAKGRIFISKDDGITWLEKSGGLPRLAATFSLASIGKKLFVATDLGVFAADIKNMSWTQARKGLPIGGDVTYFGTIGQILFLGLTDTPDERNGLYKSTDFGKSWQHVTEDIPSDLFHFRDDIAMSSGTSIEFSGDGGNSWVYIGRIPGSELGKKIIKVIPLSDSVVILSATGGLYKSKDGCYNWQEINAVFGFTIHPYTTNPLFEIGKDTIAYYAECYYSSDKLKENVFCSTNQGVNWGPLELEGIADPDGSVPSFTQMWRCGDYLFATQYHSLYRAYVSDVILTTDR